MPRDLVPLLAVTLVALAGCSSRQRAEHPAESARDSADHVNADAPPARRDTDTARPAAGSAGAADRAAVDRLEREARALAKVDGCATSGECKAAPLGAKPCGGPRAYLAYCPRSTDERALHRALDELKRAEEAYNKASGLMSDCAMVMQPTVEARAGQCRLARAPRGPQ